MIKTVYYWRGSAEVRQDIITALLSADYNVIQHRSLEEVLDRVQRDQPSLLIVDGSGGSREAARMVIELAGTPLLYPLNIVFVAQQATKRCESLGKSFASVTPVDIPYRLSMLMQWIEVLLEEPEQSTDIPESPLGKKEQLLKSFSLPDELVEEPIREREPEGGVEPEVESAAQEQEEEGEQELAAEPTAEMADEPVIEAQPAADHRQKRPSILDLSPEEIEEERAIIAAQIAAEIEEKEARKRPLRRIEDNTAIIRARIKANPNPAKLEKSFGGELFAVARDPDDYVDEYLLPTTKSGDLLKLLKELARCDRWLACHSKRLAFVSAAAATNLSFGPERDRNMRIAALFLNWSFRDATADLTRHDLIKHPSADVAQIMGDAFYQSANEVERNLRENRAATTIRAVSDIIRGVYTEVEKQLTEEAEVILAVDLSARSCWGSGFWSPAGAHKAIGYFRGEQSFITNEKIRAAIIKILAEAVTVHVTVGNVFSSGMEDDEYMEMKAKERASISAESVAAAAKHVSKPGAKKATVEISRLTPGMLLLEPLCSRDGRVIIDANVVLSKEILFDLWQLASIRALQSKVEVVIRRAKR